MGFMDKMKDVGKKALKTVLIAANEFYGSVMDDVEFGDVNIKKCLVGTNTQGKELVLFKGVNDVARISMDDVKLFIIRSNDNGKTYLTRFAFKDEKNPSFTVYSSINNDPNKSPTPGLYVGTKTENFKKFIAFLEEFGPNVSDEVTQKEIAIIKNL